MGGAAASNFYHPADAPRYRVGHGLALSFVILGMITMSAYYLICRRINAKRSQISLEGFTQQQLFELGDKAPNYQFSL